MLEQLRFVRIPVTSLSEASRFATEIVGLEPAESIEGAERFRSDFRSYSVEFDTAQGSAPVVGVSVRSPQDLDQLERRLTAVGWRAARIADKVCAAGRYHSGLAVQDFSGNHIEFVARAENSARRYFPSRDAGIVGIAHVTLGARSVADEVSVWTEVLGARVSDWLGEAAYLSWDDRHHRIALVPSRRSGNFLTVTFEVESIDAVMQSSYFFAERQVRIIRGPGREPQSGEVFLSFEGPDGSFFSYATASEVQPADRAPRQFADTTSSYCSWGSTATVPEFGGVA